MRLTIEQRKVLVLNKSWVPIRIAPFRDAMELLCSNNKGTKTPKAKIIDPTDFAQYTWADWRKMEPKDDEDVIYMVDGTPKVPLVIILTKFDKLSAHKVSFSRKALWRRDDCRCQYCGCRTRELSVDHIMPRSRGGKSVWENCVLACVKCNMKKADRTPEEAGMKLLTKPVCPRFNFFKNDIVRCKTWQQFFNEAYWSVELVD